MLKFHIIIINFSIFTNKNSQSDTFFPKLKNTIIKIDIKSFAVYKWWSLRYIYALGAMQMVILTILMYELPYVVYWVQYR